MQKITVMGKTSDGEVETLFAEEDRSVLWARRHGDFGYAVDAKGGRDATFRARAVRWTVLTGRKSTEEREDRFEIENKSLEEVKNRIRDFRSFLG